MPSDLRDLEWLNSDYAIDLNNQIVASTGEPHFVRDRGALESAMARPQNAFLYEEMCNPVHLAVRLMLGIAMSHAFEQGNKRTAFAAAVIFLENNGIDVTFSDNPDIYAASLIDVVEGRMTENEFAALILGAIT